MLGLKFKAFLFVTLSVFKSVLLLKLISDVMSFCSFAAFVRAIQRKRVRLNQAVNRKINDKSFFSADLSSLHFTCIFYLCFTHFPLVK